MQALFCTITGQHHQHFDFTQIFLNYFILFLTKSDLFCLKKSQPSPPSPIKIKKNTGILLNKTPAFSHKQTASYLKSSLCALYKALSSNTKTIYSPSINILFLCGHALAEFKIKFLILGFSAATFIPTSSDKKSA